MLTTKRSRKDTTLYFSGCRASADLSETIAQMTLGALFINKICWCLYRSREQMQRDNFNHFLATSYVYNTIHPVSHTPVCIHSTLTCDYACHLDSSSARQLYCVACGCGLRRNKLA